MENLEKYIQNNLEQFNTGEMPVGHQERFMAKLQAAQASDRQTSNTEDAGMQTGNGKGAPTRKAPRLFSRRSLFAAAGAAAGAEGASLNFSAGTRHWGHWNGGSSPLWT